MKEITPEEIQKDLYILLKTIFHYERIEVGQYGFGITELYTMEFLRRNTNVRVTDLSRELQLPMFTVSRLVNRMVRIGYLTKQQDSADHRNYFLGLDTKGLEVLNGIKEASYKRIAANLSTLDKQRTAELMGLADSLHVALGVTSEVFRK